MKSVFGSMQKKWASDNRFPEAADGDCLFLSGETWSPRYDFEVLRTLRRQRNMLLVALCQDLIPVTDPQFFDSPAFIGRFREYIDFLLNNADLIFAISQSTAAELEKLRRECNSRARIEVIYLGCDFDPSANPKPPPLSTLADRSFVISVSTIQSRKNFDLLYRVWRRFAEENKSQCPTLVIVGQRGFGTDDLLWQISNDLLVGDKVQIFHSVSDDELSWLYERCLFTLYPSFAEGWGLPISESLAYGKLCIASTTTSMPEAGQNLIIHLDPIDTMSWYKRILELVENHDEVANFEERIRRDFRPKKWKDTAEDISSSLSFLVEDHSRFLTLKP